MLKAERALYVLERLQELYPEPPIPLQHRDPYTLLVAVALSAQATDVGVNKATTPLFKKVKTPEAMVKLGLEGLKDYIKTIGLYNTKAKNVIATMFGTLDHDVLAHDFRFVAPVVGPLGKDEFIRIFGSFKLEDALPDLKENHWGFRVDPLEPNRVWWMSRPQGTHTGPLCFPPPSVIKPTNREVKWPVQAQSMLFDEQGRCYQLTVGYSCDRQTGNTGGLGAVFGLMHAIGKTLPFPEARPWKPSPPYRLGLRLAKVGERFGFGPGVSQLKSS